MKTWADLFGDDEVEQECRYCGDSDGSLVPHYCGDSNEVAFYYHIECRQLDDHHKKQALQQAQEENAAIDELVEAVGYELPSAKPAKFAKLQNRIIVGNDSVAPKDGDLRIYVTDDETTGNRIHMVTQWIEGRTYRLDQDTPLWCAAVEAYYLSQRIENFIKAPAKWDEYDTTMAGIQEAEYLRLEMGGMW